MPNILMLPGDGIGPEVCHQAQKIIDFFNQNHKTDFHTETDLIGGAAYDKFKTPLTDETIKKAQSTDAILLGAVGAPKYDNVERQARPEAGLLKIRKELDLFANLRPAITFKPLIQASSLKPEIIEDLDILILRELTGGVYFGEPRGMQTYEGVTRCIDTQAYTAQEIIRLATLGFELAKLRNNQVHSVEKANVMETGKFWRDQVTKLHEKQFHTTTLHHMYADNCAMQLVKNPKQFDVIITDNLFGDLLSDAAAMCTGSLGMLPSASLGSKNNNKQHALYEPVHGSAPDIAGKNLANPLATLLSLAMMLKYSFEMPELANLLTQAINQTLDNNIRTADIMSQNCKQVSTEQMGDAVIQQMQAIQK